MWRSAGLARLPLAVVLVRRTITTLVLCTVHHPLGALAAQQEQGLEKARWAFSCRIRMRSRTLSPCCSLRKKPREPCTSTLQEQRQEQREGEEEEEDRLRRARQLLTLWRLTGHNPRAVGRCQLEAAASSLLDGVPAAQQVPLLRRRQ